MLEDIPQLIIQILLATTLGSFSALIAISVAFSTVAVVMALVRRFLLYTVVADKSRDSERRDAEGRGDATEQDVPAALVRRDGGDVKE